ncbi:MAG TPA: AraC family transcriptional regulator [Micromonosporaceae bacterium]
MDTFAQFVAMLSEHLDDPGLSSGRLADRLHLSRSHFDRIIGSLAGETPGHFRRRVLLERAAYRLRTGERTTVLDIAVEAGYSSHEAFTRAFARAYGCSPKAWRTSTGPIAIRTPNEVHFYPPGGLRLPPQSKVTTMTFVNGLVDHHIAVLGQLLDRAETLTDAQLDAPITLPSPGIDDAPTIRSLMSRMVGQLDMWNCSLANEPYDFGVEQHETLTSIRQRLSRAGTRFTVNVSDASAQDRLNETFVDTTGAQPYLFTMGGMIAHVIEYGSFRRTAVVSALAANGSEDVDDDPLSWFAPPV